MEEVQSSEEKVQTISKADAKHGQCTIYKITGSEGNQTVSEAENNFLELEKQKNTWSYSGIKRACDAAKGGDIFLTEKEVWYWLKYKYVKEWSYSVEKQTVGKELKAKLN